MYGCTKFIHTFNYLKNENNDFFLGKIHSSLEDRHLPTAVVHGPVVVHQLHVPAVGKEVVHHYDGDDIDPQHQHSNGSPPQQVLEQERVLIKFFLVKQCSPGI